MSEYTDSKTPQPEGGQDYKQDCEPPPPPPPPPPCPDPCEQTVVYGPPKINAACCSHHECCPDDKACCTWDEVDDPCVRAASAECGVAWTRIECTCKSSNEKCDCKEWDCGGYPQGTCVPCEPCKDLIPDPTGTTGGCDDPKPGDCSAENLQEQLDALNKCISSQQSEKAKLEADMKARAERAAALKDLIKAYDDIVKKYKEQRYKLICKEDCLKGFHRDVSAGFAKYPKTYLDELQKAINAELCKYELARCCQKNLEGKLTKVTKLIWDQQEAEKEMKKADQAFAIVKDLPKWIDDRFKELEALSDEIGKALNDPDPEQQKWAFYLFYWKFAPGFCKCFPYPFCCGQKEGETATPEHLGCKPGDWHPSAITEDRLKALICCAWDSARERKQAYQAATDKVAEVTINLDFMKKKVEADGKIIPDRIKSGLEKVNAPTPTSAA